MAQVDIELKNIVREFPTRRDGQIIRAVDDISLQIYDGEFFALLGPSGCGKTTTLRMIAGFEQPTSGEILIRGQAVQNVPPFHRPVNTVFQDYALFPHMSVLKNVMFGLEMEGIPRHVARQRALEALNMVQLPQAADRKPRQLSGGQQQRVALARALVKEPAVLLLDEPLGALDLKLRKAMQFELKAMQQKLGITFIYVTHDQEEAMTMADRIAVMDHGKVLQIGRPEEIYETPATRFVADFIGETNFLLGKIDRINETTCCVQLDDETIVEATIGSTAVVPGQAVTVAIRPEKVGLFPIEGAAKRGEGFVVPATEVTASLEKEKNTTLIDGVIHQSQYIGTDTRYVVLIGKKSELVVRIQNFGHRYDTIFKDGQRVHIFWDNENARILSH
jgi:spermidine/putrescine transport system ATP-binding protein